MDVLVVGASGLLGGNVVTVAQERGWSVAGTYHSDPPAFDCPLYELDVRSSAECENVLEETSPDAVINCAAATDVDDCENNPGLATNVNAEGAGTVAELAAETDTALLHTSTDYVFDGTRSSPYPETASTNPIQVYGTSKLEGERAVQQAHDTAIVARLSFVYGRTQPEGELSGFPAWVRETAKGGETVPLFTDQRITPSQAGTTARTLLDLLDHDAKGTFNVASRSCVTPYEFGEALLEEFGELTDLLEESSVEDIDRDADRPKYTCLDTSKVESALGRPQPTLDEDFAALF
ncbi:SDR family oxidoreductase [Natronoarchaeum mannanilyticum]|uniref:dTDP-4-dehydrorhamnose reductase n=1 Tax=Natronoarchaeum mannanilyticum TaxID=926360 RepID=A0AAV3T928_9EURY